MSSRPHALPLAIPGYTVATLQPITEEKMELVIHRFPWEDRDRAAKLIATLKASPELSALARNPLLLMLIIVMATRHDPVALPKRREEIYKHIVNLLLGEWDRAKAVVRQRAIEDEQLLLRVLQKVAYLLYSREQRAFTKDTFIDLARTAIPGKPLGFETALELFNSLLHDCMLIPLSPDTYGFFHLSIQEYLVAEDLASDVDAARVWRAVEEYFRRGGWWEEVLVFYAGIKRDVSFLINSLHQHLILSVARASNNPGLLNLVKRWVEVADLMNPADLNPQGTVAGAFANLNVAGDSERWNKLLTYR